MNRRVDNRVRAAGKGKTILRMSLLQYSEERFRKKGAYISFRESQTTLYANMAELEMDVQRLEDTGNNDASLELARLNLSILPRVLDIVDWHLKLTTNTSMHSHRVKWKQRKTKKGSREERARHYVTIPSPTA